MWWFVGAFNRPLMEKHLGMYAVGIFAVANKFPNILTILSYIFLASWQVSVLDEFEKEGYVHFFNKIFRLVITALFVFYFIITISSKFIINIFTTHDFHEASRYVPLLTLGCMFSCISGLVGSNFSAARKSKYYFYSSIWGAGISFVCNLFLIRRIGTVGAAITVPMSFAAMAVSRIVYSWQYVKIKNIVFYIFIVSMCVVLAIITLLLTNVSKYFFISIIFILFICLNCSFEESRNDIKKIYQWVKSIKPNNRIR
jgi:O-antigen/teichoic acid export membrane protein